jgi:hypothetical protein
MEFCWGFSMVAEGLRFLIWEKLGGALVIDERETGAGCIIKSNFSMDSREGRRERHKSGFRWILLRLEGASFTFGKSCDQRATEGK